jgi:uncharacterized flavoprotein (TIGR03862 family)
MNPETSSLVVIGGGPAGLMAAEVARAAGCEVDLYDAMGSVGRKILIAGKGGLNLTHSEPFDAFVARFGARADWVRPWLTEFDADALRAWARGLGVETRIGTSGRVFPEDLKAAPLLRGWVRRLRDQGVRFHVQHRWLGWSPDGALRFATPDGAECHVEAAATVLALGGASWPELGSDGRWTQSLADRGVPLAPLRPANCGFEADWSEHFATRHAGAPVKPVRARFVDAQGTTHAQQGEFVITAQGLEGSLIYALAAPLRDTIDAHGRVELQLDLAPDRDIDRLREDLARPAGKRSLSEHLRRHAGLSAVKIGLLHEVLPRPLDPSPAMLAAAIKSLPVVLRRTRPIEEAISSAGGVRRSALDDELMLSACPGVFCAGEMLDWEAPTGGYLLTACFASGRVAARGALRWLQQGAPG